LLGVVALEGGECLGEGRQTVGVVFGIVGSVVACILHGGVVSFVFSVFLNPKTFELVPLDEGWVRVEAVVFAEFILELAGVFDD
jgi:hypothetical protein